MYLEHFGLRERPFSLSPNPRFFYYSQSHLEAVSQCVYAITQQSGFMILTGEVGTGKTTLVRAIRQKLSKDYVIANIFHTETSPKGLIQNICREYGIEFKRETLMELVLKLHGFLLSTNRDGKKAILIIDEAQNLKRAALEEIRLLSNYEENDEKFLQMILIGQPELMAKLDDPRLRQLQNRIGLSYRLRKLTCEQTSTYILHRLSVAGCAKPGLVFQQQAREYVHEISGGTPRLINVLCDRALLFGFSAGAKSIEMEMVEQVRLDKYPHHDEPNHDFQSEIATERERTVKPASGFIERFKIRSDNKTSPVVVGSSALRLVVAVLLLPLVLNILLLLLVIYSSKF